MAVKHRLFNILHTIVVLFVPVFFFSVFASLFLNTNSVYADYAITMTTDDSVTLRAPARGGTAIGSASVNIITNCTAGYTLTLHSTQNNTNRDYLGLRKSHKTPT